MTRAVLNRLRVVGVTKDYIDCQDRKTGQVWRLTGGEWQEVQG